jgi:hypothetical protein
MSNKPGPAMVDGDKKRIRNSTAEFLIFTNQAAEQSIEARFENETVWLTQKLMAELFAVDVRTISEHLKNIFTSGELSEDSVIRKFRITAADGKGYQTQFYNLDGIISVGYRVNSGDQWDQIRLIEYFFSYPRLWSSVKNRSSLTPLIMTPLIQQKVLHLVVESALC